MSLGARPASVVVVPNGVDIDHLRHHASSARDDEVRVGMLARFDPQKGHDVFLRVATALRDTGATFVLGASGSAYKEYEASIRSEATWPARSPTVVARENKLCGKPPRPWNDESSALPRSATMIESNPSSSTSF